MKAQYITPVCVAIALILILKYGIPWLAEEFEQIWSWIISDSMGGS